MMLTSSVGRSFNTAALILEAVMDPSPIDVRRFEVDEFGDLRLKQRGLVSSGSGVFTELVHSGSSKRSAA
jgi:hypothetical protein